VLAGKVRSTDDGADFAVHVWLDDTGRESRDYALSAPENAKYLAYYRDMGVPDPQGFYAMTNSVPFEEARWLTGAQLRGWLGETDTAAPTLAYLDLGPSLP
jgi:hypothetical protein